MCALRRCLNSPSRSAPLFKRRARENPSPPKKETRVQELLSAPRQTRARQKRKHVFKNFSPLRAKKMIRTPIFEHGQKSTVKKSRGKRLRFLIQKNGDLDKVDDVRSSRFARTKP